MTDNAIEITDLVKQREAEGYSYEAADASFELLVRRMTGQLEEPFELVNSFDPLTGRKVRI